MDAKHKLVHVDLNAIVFQASEELVEGSILAFRVGAGDEEVINVDEVERKAPHYFIYEALEGLGCIFRSNRHPGVLEQAKRDDDGSLRDIFWLNRDLVNYLN